MNGRTVAGILPMAVTIIRGYLILKTKVHMCHDHKRLILKKTARSAICAAGIAAACVTGCSDYADALIIIHLRAHVLSVDGQPVRQAALWLKDHRFEGSLPPRLLQKPVCVTDGRGECAVEIRYGYGYTSWPVLRHIVKDPPLSDRFELIVIRGGKSIARRRLAPLDRPQVQGASDVDIHIRLDH